MASSLPAADPAPSLQPAAQSPADPSAAAWEKITRRLDNPGSLDSDEATGNFVKEAIVSLSAFLADYPWSPHAGEARFSRAQMRLYSLKDGQEKNPDLAPIEKDLRVVMADPAAPASTKDVAAILLLQAKARHGSSEDLDRELTAYEKANPGKPVPREILPLLVEKLAKANPEKTQKLQARLEVELTAFRARQAEENAKAEAAMRKWLHQPLDLRFTAVDGSQIDLQKMHGKVVLVDFWATWCGPCMQEVPNVVATYKKYHDRGFEIVGISFDQDKGALLKTIGDKGMTWPQYFDGKGFGNEFGQRFGIRGIPTMWLVDKDGRLVDANGRDGLEGKVAKLLGK